MIRINIRIRCGKDSVEFPHKVAEKEITNVLSLSLAKAKEVGNAVFNPRGNLNRHELEYSVQVYNEDN